MSTLQFALLSVAVFFTACSHAQQNGQAPDPDYFLPIVTVGSEGGTPVPFYGCNDNGATLLTLGVWANDKWIRGLRASLTDGRQNFFGCLTVGGDNDGQTGCQDSGVRSSNFTFEAGERITNLTMWPGYDLASEANQRAGALSFNTSLGRSFDFGMTDARQNGTSISVGQGIPCGIAPKAGADIDSMGFIFLRNVTANALQNVQYSGVPANDAGGEVATDVAPLDESAAVVILGDQIYNNTGKTSSLDATSSAQATHTVKSEWSSAPGLDSYLLAPVNASVPQLTDTSNSSYIRWKLGTQEVHPRNETQQYEEGWNYTVSIGPGGVSQIVGSTLQGNITATYSSRLNVTLESGANFSVPVSGQFQGLSSSPVELKVVEITASTQASSSSTGGGHSNTVAWVVGVLVGVIVGLLLAALLAWAMVLLMRRRNKRAQEKQQNNSQPPSNPKTWPHIPAAIFPGTFGKGKGSSEKVTQKDVELGTPGKSKWYVDESDAAPKPSPVVGFPVSKSKKGKQEELPPQEGELPESEGEHVLPYTVFRRLRLDSLRQSLGLGDDASTPVSKTAVYAKPAAKDGTAKDKAAASDGSSTPLSRTAAALRKLEDNEEQLSTPASNASTPRTLPDMAGRDLPEGSSSDTGAESIVASDLGNVVDDDKVAVPWEAEDEKLLVSKNDAQRKQIREQIARKMAERRPSPKPERNPDPPSIFEPPTAAGQSPSSYGRKPFFKKLSDTVANYRGPSGAHIPHPSGLEKSEVRSDAMQHANTSLRLGAGYKSAQDSKALEKNTLSHDDAKLKLGVKYHTQGRNE